ncbi:hypothetical protein AB0P21_40190 [Kribbella sp. NPDC056861]|uniref:hypothetical protein n=1 Tax=Kribbella sp. NPDC056861 TaxID=3154857 RepID=UPI00343A9B36
MDIGRVVAAGQHRLSNRRVAVICVAGPRSAGRDLVETVRGLGHEAIECSIGADREWTVGIEKGIEAACRVLQDCDLAVLAASGHDRLVAEVRSLLRLLGVRSVGGSGPANLAALDQQLAKKVLLAEGLAVTSGLTVTSADEFEQSDLDEAGLRYPAVVRAAGGAVTTVADQASLRHLIDTSGEELLVTNTGPGMRFAVAVLQLPDRSLHAVAAPALADAGLALDLRVTAIEAFQLLRCSGPASIGFIVLGQGRPIVDSVEVMPDLEVSALYPRAWTTAGLSYPALVNVLLSAASW